MHSIEPRKERMPKLTSAERRKAANAKKSKEEAAEAAKRKSEREKKLKEENEEVWKKKKCLASKTKRKLETTDEASERNKVNKVRLMISC